MRTPNKTEPAEKMPVAYKDLRALKIAKSKRALPRGTSVDFSLEDNKLTFKAPGQTGPVLEIALISYVEGCLKADGFKLAQ